MTGSFTDNLPESLPISDTIFIQRPTSFRLQIGDEIGITMNSRHTKTKQKGKEVH
jgi:hypothetical protein